MRTWTRAPIVTACGRCGRTIPVGEPLLELRLAGTLHKDGAPVADISVRHRLFRCAACVDEPIPADLPPLEPRSTAITPTLLVPSGPGTLPLDFKKTAAGGDR